MSSVDTNLFRSDLVFYDVSAHDCFELFAWLENELMDRGCIKPTWLAAITERERSYPTGLACQAISIAIPHTDPEHLERPYIAIIKPAAPIKFEPMANMGEPVEAQLIINLGLKAHDDEQVAILQALMGVFMDDVAAADILAQSTPQGMADAMARHVSRSCQQR